MSVCNIMFRAEKTGLITGMCENAFSVNVLKVWQAAFLGCISVCLYKISGCTCTGLGDWSIPCVIFQSVLKVLSISCNMGNLVFISTDFETIYQANSPCYFVNTIMHWQSQNMTYIFKVYITHNDRLIIVIHHFHFYSNCK